MPLANHAVSRTDFHKSVEEGSVAKLNHSTWLVTVNTNKHSMKPEQLEKFVEGMNVLFDDSGKGLTDYIEEGAFKDPNFRDKIENIIIDGAFENLSDTGDLHLVQLHLHVVIDIAHRTNISFNSNNLRNDIAKFMPGMYVHVKRIERSVESADDYVHKWDQNKIGRNAPPITIDYDAPSFRDWLYSKGVETNSKVKSNLHKKMEGAKSILGQIMSRPKETHKELVKKVGKKFGKTDYFEILSDLSDKDDTITFEELEYFGKL